MFLTFPTIDFPRLLISYHIVYDFVCCSRPQNTHHSFVFSSIVFVPLKTSVDFWNWTTAGTFTASCGPNKFRCENGPCIAMALKCNGRVDCPYDTSDELDCTDEFQCKCRGFVPRVPRVRPVVFDAFASGINFAPISNSVLVLE